MKTRALYTNLSTSKRRRESLSTELTHIQFSTERELVKHMGTIIDAIQRARQEALDEGFTGHEMVVLLSVRDYYRLRALDYELPVLAGADYYNRNNPVQICGLPVHINHFLDSGDGGMVLVRLIDRTDCEFDIAIFPLDALD